MAGGRWFAITCFAILMTHRSRSWLIMPLYKRILLPPGICHYYCLKKVDPYRKNGVWYNYRLYSAAYGDFRRLRPKPKRSSKRPMLKHTFRFQDGTSKRLDLHRVAALNYRCCNPDRFCGDPRDGYDGQRVHAHHKDEVLHVRGRTVSGWRNSCRENLEVLSRDDHQDLHG